MDCEKFDHHVIDALYDELDELTNAAMKRHMEGCGRCADVLAGLRATRSVGVLPLEEPSADFESRILAAAEAAQRTTPWHRKVLRGLAWAGSHAMRPQLAMAALFFLVIGSSLLLLRAKPGTVGTSPVRVTERGVPAPEEVEQATDSLSTAPAAVAEAQGAAPSPTSSPALPADSERAAKSDGDSKGGGDTAKVEGNKDKRSEEAQVALGRARAAHGKAGCSRDVVKQYDEVGSNYPATPAAAAARWEAANCYKDLGESANARQLYLSLRDADGYRDRAEVRGAVEEEAKSATNQAPGGGNAVAGAAAAAAPNRAPAAAAPARQAAAKPARAAESPPQARPPSAAPGSTGKAPAAPKRAIDSADAYSSDPSDAAR